MIQESSTIAKDLKEEGFLLLKEPPYMRDLIKETYNVWSQLFSDKSKFSLYGNVTAPIGYVPINFSNGCDLKESYYYQVGMKLPSKVEIPTQKLVVIFQELARVVTKALEVAVGNTLIHSPTGGCLRIMRYPAFTGEEESILMQHLAEQGQLRTPEHTDLNALTFLPYSTAPGLEIYKRDDGWFSVNEKGDNILVHAGQELEKSSGGHFKATIHRVCNPLPKEKNMPRMSMAFFVS